MFLFLAAVMVIELLVSFLEASQENGITKKWTVSAIVKKAGSLFLWALAIITDELLARIAPQIGFIESPVNVRLVTEMWLFASEGLQIIRNLKEIGVIAPDALTDFLNKLKKK